MKPIISVKEARKLLGKEHQELTDDKVAELVKQLHELAKMSLDMARERLLTGEMSEEPIKKTLGQK